MNIGAVWVDIPMTLRTANPAAVAKIKRLARATGLTETAAVERAVEALLQNHDSDQRRGMRHRMDAILAQIDRIPDLPEPFDPLDWDESGLPR
jgi:hypothetical protein